jgi:hypothetical protein
MQASHKSAGRSSRRGRWSPLFSALARRVWWGLLILGCVAFSGLASSAQSLSVIVHPTVEVDELSFTEFRKIIMGDRQFWTTGQRIAIIVRAPVAAERSVLLERVFKMNEAQYRQYWVAKVFRAEVVSGPRVVLSNEEAVDLVTVIEGAIAVVNSEDVPEGFKVLKIGGALPGEPGYPLNLKQDP